MNVKGFFKNVLSNDATGDSSVNPQSPNEASAKMSTFLSNTSRLLDSVQTKKEGLFNDITNKLNSIKLPVDLRRDSSAPSQTPKHDNDGGDSSASEYGDDGDQPMYAEEAPVERQGSVDSVDSLPEEEATQLKTDMNELVEAIFNGRTINHNMREKFQKYLECHTGRSVFAKEIRSYVYTHKSVSFSVLNQLAEFVGLVLNKCNETDDFSPATVLMNAAFTVYHEKPAANIRDQTVLNYLFTLLTNQSIWQSMRFWNAAFFVAIQNERKKQSSYSITNGEAVTINAEEVQNNAAFVQISKFTWRMHALGIAKQPCLDFLRKQALAENVSKDNFRILHGNYLKLYRNETDQLQEGQEI